MKRNIGNLERALRVFVGIVMVAVGFAVMDGAAGIAVGVIGLIPLLTGLTGWCPLYTLFKKNPVKQSWPFETGIITDACYCRPSAHNGDTHEAHVYVRELNIHRATRQTPKASSLAPTPMLILRITSDWVGGTFHL